MDLTGLSPELAEGIARLQVERDLALEKLGGRRVRARVSIDGVVEGTLEAANHVADGLVLVRRDSLGRVIKRYNTQHVISVRRIDGVVEREAYVSWVEAL